VVTLPQTGTVGRSDRLGHIRESPTADFRLDIEGLRAVAVLAVVLFHAGLPGVGGGYIGVDVFFVISGFLITGLLRREVTATGTVRLGRFYGARARRLLPASTTVGVATAIAAAALLAPLRARTVLGDGIASALYVGNYRFAIHGTDYLAGDTAPSPFQHYWSLGVEEQFYLLWPALLIGTAWLTGRPRVATRITPSANPFLVVLALVATTSFALSLVWTHSSPPWAFFSLPARAWELAAGGLVALSADRWRRLPARAAAIAGWGGLALIVLSCNQLGERTPYPGTAALLPVMGTALVIGAGGAAGSDGPERLLSLRGMRAIGRVSYSWYLWHWPVLLLLPPLLGHSTGLPGRLAAVVVSAGLATLTLHLVENPGRFATSLRRSTGRSLAVGGAATAVAAGAGLLLLVVVPAPVGRGTAAAAPTIKITPPSDPANHSGDPYDAAVQNGFAQAQAAVTASAGLMAVPSNMDPPLADAPADKPRVFLNGCVRSWLEVGQGDCATGDTTSGTMVALVGDSHAAMWSPPLTQIAEQRHWRLETLGKITCPLLNLPITSPYLGREYSECAQWRDQIITRLQAEHPKLVVLSMSRRYGADFSFTSYDPAWIDRLTRTVTQLRATGAKVLVLGPIPDPHTTVPTCLSDHLENAGACSPPRALGINGAGVAAEQTATTAGGGQYADLTPLFCTAERCPVIIGNELVYRDDNHVTIEYAQTLGPVLGALADRALAPG
jgi:peptidoglycan/LPS O-acetylase OafA/YrhL